MKKVFYISILTLILVFVALPFAVLAADPVGLGNFIPCDGGGADPCTFAHLLKLVDNILGWLVNYMAIPVATITFAWAGFTYLTTGISDKKTKAKEMLWKVIIGFTFILAARLIVSAITKLLLAPGIVN